MRRAHVLATFACAAVAAWLILAPGRGGPSPASQGAGGPSGSAGLEGPAAPPPGAQAPVPFSASGVQSRERQIAVLQLRYDMAARTYASYVDATRYPPHSRPLAEHPDQARPFDPVVEDLPLRDAGGRSAGAVRIRTTQERIFLAGNDATRLTLEAVDVDGRPVPLTVQRSVAQTLPDGRTLEPLLRRDLPFRDDGSGGDEVAADARHTALLQPSVQGFAGRAGTIRVLAEVSAAGQAGLVPFDVIYEPAVAGRWLGVREALEDGNLNFYLQAFVDAPGRYVASARVYSSEGEPVALLQFNEELPAGNVEMRLSLAGLLVRDRPPAWPLRLVDVEAFQLKPDTFPDRVMMPRLAGAIHTSGHYPIAGFSGSEWRSEERDRHTAEFARDLQESFNALSRLRR